MSFQSAHQPTSQQTQRLKVKLFFIRTIIYPISPPGTNFTNPRSKAVADLCITDLNFLPKFIEKIQLLLKIVLHLDSLSVGLWGKIAMVQRLSGSAMRQNSLRLIPSPDMDIWTSLMPKNITVEYTYETQHWSSMSDVCKKPYPDISTLVR